MCQFHQCFTSAKFWRQKITKPNITREMRFCMKNVRVKCWWNVSLPVRPSYITWLSDFRPRWTFSAFKIIYFIILYLKKSFFFLLLKCEKSENLGSNIFFYSDKIKFLRNFINDQLELIIKLLIKTILFFLT